MAIAFIAFCWTLRTLPQSGGRPFSERARLVRTVPGYGKALAAGEGRRIW